MNLPTSFSDGGVRWKRQSPESQPQPRSWWRLYNDGTLNSLVDRGLSANQELAAADARLKQARDLSRAARSRFFPAIDLNSTTERSQSRFRGPGGGSLLQNNFTLPIDWSWELDAWGKIRRQMEAAGATEAATAETRNAVRLTIAAEIAQTYWALRAVDADRELLDRTLELRRKALDLITRQRDAGAISDLDLARVETEVATAEADRIGLDRERVELVNALAVLTGSSATGSSVPESSQLPGPPSIPTTIPSELLRQRPDIRAAEYRVAAANAEIGVAIAMFYPSFTFRASGGYDSMILNNLLSADALVWSIGSGITSPISAHGLLRAQRDAAVAAHAAASAEYRQTVLVAMSEVENALQGSTILARQETAQQTAVTAARKTLDLSSKRFNAGLVSFLDVVDAERTRLDTERSLNALRASRLAVSVALVKSLGGEWR
jgi:multidrug efflux system outer membrane protein